MDIHFNIGTHILRKRIGGVQFGSLHTVYNVHKCHVILYVYTCPETFLDPPLLIIIISKIW